MEQLNGTLLILCAGMLAFIALRDRSHVKLARENNRQSAQLQQTEQEMREQRCLLTDAREAVIGMEVELAGAHGELEKTRHLWADCSRKDADATNQRVEGIQGLLDSAQAARLELSATVTELRRELATAHEQRNAEVAGAVEKDATLSKVDELLGAMLTLLHPKKAAGAVTARKFWEEACRSVMPLEGEVARERAEGMLRLKSSD